MKKVTNLLVLSVVVVAMTAETSYGCCWRRDKKRKSPEMESVQVATSNGDHVKRVRRGGRNLQADVAAFMNMSEAEREQYIIEILHADDVDFVNALLDEDPKVLDGVKIDFFGHGWSEPVIYIALGHTERIAICLLAREAGGYKNLKPSALYIDLHCAMERKNRPELVCALVKKITSKRVIDGDDTALGYAARRICVEMMRLLLKGYRYAVLVETAAHEYSGPLVKVVADEWKACPLDVIDAYVLEFVDISDKVNVEDAQGHAALWYAIKARDEAVIGSQKRADAEEIIKMLEEAGATE